MKNREKYREQIAEYSGGISFCEDFVLPVILRKSDCRGFCNQCHLIQAIWLNEEYKEPEVVDWSKVEVDTPIKVSADGKKWINGYFAGVDGGGYVGAWLGGATSWSTPEGDINYWRFARLVEEK